MNEQRLDKLESDMLDLKDEVQTNTKITIQVKTDVSELLQAFNDVKGFWKVIEFIGKAAKPLAWIAATSTALIVWWRDIMGIFKHGS